MHKLLSLIKIQLKMNLMAGMTYRSKKGKDMTLLVTCIATAAIAVIFLPLIVRTVIFLHRNLSIVGMQDLIVQVGVVLFSLVVMLFATLSVLETFYYSKDVDYLLPLPLKPTDLIISKFTVALVAQYTLFALFYFPLLITFGVLEGAGALFYILTFVLFFLIPVFPTLLLCIVLMIFMRITSFGKNRDLIRAIFMFLIIIISAIGGGMIGAQVEGIDLDLAAFAETPVMRVITFIFRPVMMGADVILNPTNEIVSLLLFFIIIAATFFIFMAIGKLLYLPTIVGYTDSQSKKEALTADDLASLSASHSIFKTLIRREFKLIMRTPIFALNCFLLPLMMPIIMVIAGVLGGGGMEDIGYAVEYLREIGFLTENFMASTIGILFAIVYFMTSYNSTALSSFSREGKTLFTWKYFPIMLSQIIKVKLVMAILSNLLPLTLTTMGLVFLLNLSFLQTLALVVFMIAALTFSSTAFLFFDLSAPRLNWDSEQQAMKGGLAQAVLSLGNILIAVGIGVSAWFISQVWVVVSLGILLPLSGSMILLFVLQKKGQRLFDRME